MLYCGTDNTFQIEQVDKYDYFKVLCFGSLQPLLVALRRRCSLKSSLPTIYEYTEGQPYCYHMESSIEEPSLYEEYGEDEEDEDEMDDKLDMEQWSITEQKSSGSFSLNYCER